MRRNPSGASGLCARRRRVWRPLYIGRPIKRDFSSFPTKKKTNQIEFKCHSRLQQMLTCVINVRPMKFVYITVIRQLQSRLDVCVNQWHILVLIYQHTHFLYVSVYFLFFHSTYYGNNFIKEVTNKATMTCCTGHVCFPQI